VTNDRYNVSLMAMALLARGALGFSPLWTQQVVVASRDMYCGAIRRTREEERKRCAVTTSFIWDRIRLDRWIEARMKRGGSTNTNPYTT